MGSSFQFIDIILFAMIAVFLILRLRNVLGRRDGREGGHRDPFGPNVSAKEISDGQDKKTIQLPDGKDENLFSGDEDDPPTPVDGDAALAAGVAEIQRLDNTFNAEDFLVGAHVAFEMVLDGYSNHDRKILENLLSPEVLANFLRAIDEREEAGHVMEDTLVSIDKSNIVEAYIESEMAQVTVKFVSEQINVVRDSEGQIASGNPNEVINVVDLWTFARDIRSTNPNWALVATHSLD